MKQYCKLNDFFGKYKLTDRMLPGIYQCYKKSVLQFYYNRIILNLQYKFIKWKILNNGLKLKKQFIMKYKC